jgi:membrane protease YdiL (CAAX protease family)
MIQMLPWVANIPSIPAPVAAAFAVEAALYVLTMIEGARKRLEARLRRPALALAMTAGAALPYCLYAPPAGLFRWQSLAAILALAAAAAFWFVALPHCRGFDLAYIAATGAAVLFVPFARIYATPAPRLPLFILGQLMLTRLAILECLSIRRLHADGFGLFPRRREWAAGVVHFLLFLPVGALAAWALKVAVFHPRGNAYTMALTAAATFLGMLWMVALREEFFFRGLLQCWFGRWMKSDAAGLAVASVLFGLLHLGFRGFPNWRFAILAALAGAFYGRAYLATRSVRAAMVAHALVNTVWRVWFW